MTTRFSDDLSASKEAIEALPLNSILARLFTGFATAREASDSLDKKGIDYFVILRDGQHLRVDIKLRRRDPRRWRKDDIAIELWSSVESSITGYRARDTEFIVWIFADTLRAVAVPFRPFQRMVAHRRQAMLRASPVFSQTTMGRDGRCYTSQHTYLPLSLFRGIAKEWSSQTYIAKRETSQRLSDWRRSR